MNYREPEPAPVSGCSRTSAWGLVVLGAGLQVFLTWHQVIVHSESRRYGIEVPWVSLLLTFLAFGSLVVGAALAAYWRYYGVSIAVGAFIVAMLGLISLGVLAGIGM